MHYWYKYECAMVEMANRETCVYQAGRHLSKSVTTHFPVILVAVNKYLNHSGTTRSETVYDATSSVCMHTANPRRKGVNANILYLVQIYLHPRQVCYTVRGHYNTVYFTTILPTTLQWYWQNVYQYYKHNRHPIYRPHGRAMGCIAMIVENNDRVIRD